MTFWNDRFATSEFVFGQEPSQFVVRHSALLKPHSEVFLPADGEGRNSVYLAKLGHQISAFDFSPNAIEKARDLAKRNDVEVEFSVCDIENYPWQIDYFDAAFAVFIQFTPPPLRDEIIRNIQKSVKLGGLVFVHGYTPKQLEYKTGGPTNIENLYTAENLSALFFDFDILELKEYDTELDEGTGHKGMSALIDLVTRRRD